MNSLILKILLVVYSLYSLLKFIESFIRSDENKAKGLYKIYVQGNGSVIKIFDNVILVLMMLFLVLLFVSGVEYVSFTTGLLVGMTIIQVFFHRFSVPNHLRLSLVLRENR